MKFYNYKTAILLACKIIFLLFIFAISPIWRTSAGDIQYIYDSQNRLIEVRYPDKIIHYTYDAAGNRTGITVEILTAAPAITNINPNTATVGGNAFTLTVSGNNFTNNSVVQWNGSNRPTTLINANQLTANIPATDVALLGTATITVFNPTTNRTSNAQSFTVQSGATNCISISIPNNLTAPTNTAVTIPITIGNVTNVGIDSYSFDLQFNSSVITPAALPIATTNTLSGAMNVTTESVQEGRLLVTANGNSYLTGQGTLLNLKFNVIGAPQSNSNLLWQNFQFTNENLCASVSNGQITVGNPAYTIRGAVTYGTTPANQTKAVSGVTISAGGAYSTTTNSTGTYLLENLTTGGNYTVTASKNDDRNGISPFDATMVLRHIAANGTGPNALSLIQQKAADANGDGNISPFDATQILRYVAANGPNANTGQVGNWKFSPPSINYPALNEPVSGANYTAFLVGEVNGDWRAPNSLSESTEAKEKEIAILVNATDSSVVISTPKIDLVQKKELELTDNIEQAEETIAEARELQKEAVEIQLSLPENMLVATDDVVSIPVLLTNTTSKQISSYNFAVRFDPNLLQPETTAVETKDSLSSNGFTIVSDTNQKGRIGIAASSLNNSVRSSGTLLYLRFRVVGSVKDAGNAAMALSFEIGKKNNNRVGMFEALFGNRISSASTNSSLIVVANKPKE